ncbi:MAG: DUF2125 domain-containing protein [Alphaproteobacteria bacterium]|nr:DUF2125 domain-containing protein [Alphaproteobacteria bacterium]
MTTPNTDDDKLTKSAENMEKSAFDDVLSPKVDKGFFAEEGEDPPPKKPLIKRIRKKIKTALKTKFLRRVLFFGTLSASIIIVLGYLWLCLATERALRNNTVSLLENLQTQGFIVSYDSIDSTYYPFSSGIYVNNLSVTAPTFLGGWKWEMGKVAVSTYPVISDELLINAKGMQKISLPKDDYSLQFITKDIAFKIISNPEQGMSSFVGTLDYSMALAPQNIRSSAVLASVSFAVKKKSLGTYDFSFVLDDLQFPNEHKKLIVVDDAALSGYINAFETRDTIKDTLLDWQKSDGSISLQKIRIDWDDFQMQGDANITLDANMQPVVAGIARMKGFLDFVSMLVDYGIAPKKEANIVKIVYEQGAKSTEKAFRTLFSIQHNKLYIGYLPLLKLPDLPLKEIALTPSEEEDEEEGEENEDEAKENPKK